MPKKLYGLSVRVLSHWFQTGRPGSEGDMGEGQGPAEHKCDLAQGNYIQIVILPSKYFIFFT